MGDINSVHLQKWIKGLMIDFDITVFSLDPLNVSNSIDDSLNKVRIVCNEEHTTNIKNKSTYLKSLRKFKKVYQEIQPDIVHAHYGTSYGLLGRRLKPRKLFISVWGSDVYEFPKKSFFHKAVFKWILKGADQLFSTSEDMKKELSKYTRKNINVIPFGIDLGLYEARADSAPRDKFIIGTVKSLEHIYGIDRLIRAFSIFHKKYSKSECHIYGDGSERNNLINLTRELGLEKSVLFKGRIEHKLVPGVLATLDVFCMLSRSESFGVAALEASACEVPIIATGVGGIPEVVIDGETGFIVEADDKIVADKLTILIENREVGAGLGAQGRKFVENDYNWKNNLAAMKEFYIA